MGVNKCVSEYMASLLLGVFSKDSSGVESEMTLSLLSIPFRGFHCCKTVLISGVALLASDFCCRVVCLHSSSKPVFSQQHNHMWLH